MGLGVRRLTKDKKEEIEAKEAFSIHLCLVFLTIASFLCLTVVATLFSANDSHAGIPSSRLVQLI